MQNLSEVGLHIKFNLCFFYSINVYVYSLISVIHIYIEVSLKLCILTPYTLICIYRHTGEHIAILSEGSYNYIIFVMAIYKKSFM